STARFTPLLKIGYQAPVRRGASPSSSRFAANHSRAQPRICSIALEIAVLGPKICDLGNRCTMRRHGSREVPEPGIFAQDTVGPTARPLRRLLGVRRMGTTLRTWAAVSAARSEERRVGKECRCRWAPGR